MSDDARVVTIPVKFPPESPPMTQPTPTLLELLDRAEKALRTAHEYRVVPEHVPVADGLRAASQRLREEMERTRLHPLVNSAAIALNYVNGGPLKP